MAVDVLEPEHVEHEHAGAAREAARHPAFHEGGWLRALWTTPLAFGLATALVCGIRYGAHWDPVWDLPVLLTAWTIVTPLGFLLGMGAFDYWLYWVSGKQTRPEDHSGHGADSWRDYLRVNTDHKVIGVQYLCTTFIFYLIAGFLALLMRAELAQPGQDVVDTQAFNGLVSSHAGLMIFLFIVPGVRGLRELRHPAHDRSA